MSSDGEDAQGSTAVWRRRAGTLVGLGLALVLGAICFEGLVRLAVGQGWLHTPTPNRGQTGFWWGGHPTLGVWRHPDREGPLTGPCYSVTYRTNSVGARDRERPRRADGPRVAVLGDSFLEGWGVEVEDRVSDRLERETGIPHLNFAMAHFGPYQQLLAYREIASRFDHDAVIASVLPINDFLDSELELAETLPGYEFRYRPYLVGDPPDLREVSYREPTWRRWLRHHSFAWNALRSRLDGLRAPPARRPDHSWFYDVEQRRVRLMQEILRRLADEVEGRPLAVLMIPALRDLQRYARSGPSPLVERLRQDGREHGYRVVDLLSAMGDRTRNWPAYFIPCDYHWSRFGNRAAEELTRALLEEEFYAPLRARAVAPGGEARGPGEAR
ncbi:MAG: hypothetical protein ACQGVK_19320 [Myxococcota bacterium]